MSNAKISRSLQDINLLIQSGQLEPALVSLQKYLKVQRKDYRAWYMKGAAEAKLNRLNEAESSFLRALKLNPQSLDNLFGLGQLYLQMQDWPKAIERLETVLEQRSDLPQIRNDLARAYNNQGTAVSSEGNMHEGVRFFEKALSFNQHLAVAHANLATNLEKLQQLETARAAAETALQLDMDNFAAAMVLLKLDNREECYPQALERARNLSRQQTEPYHIAMARMEAARALDYMAKAAEAWSEFKAAKNILLPIPEYQTRMNAYFEAFLRIANNAETYETSQWKEHGVADNHHVPVVFLVGFPRSGTTLCEQILEKHSTVTATHERPVIPYLLNNLSRIIGRDFEYWENPGNLQGHEIKQLRDVYRVQFSDLIKELPNGGYLLDKLPLNMVNIGFIKRVFPESRFIFSVRDPRDCCLSCYFQSFELNPAMCQFLDFDRTTEFYTRAMHLWSVYKGIPTLKYHEYRYEDLVADMRGEIEKILDFTGLVWEEGLEDHVALSGKRFARTPSYQAVSKPINNKAIGRWKPYAEYLLPFEERLEKVLAEYHYEE